MRTLTAQGEVSVDHVDGSLPSVPVGPGAEHFTRAAKCQDVEQTAQENMRPIHNWPGYGECVLTRNYQIWQGHELTPLLTRYNLNSSRLFDDSTISK